MERSNAYNMLFSGYGSSELFSATSVETIDARYDFSKPIMSVGIPYAEITMGVFDDNGNELEYNKRGELRIKSRSAMKEYYNKPELTAQTKVNGWIHTGDLAEIDEQGFVYIWGRMKDTVKLTNGREIYLFDIANKIKEKDYIDDAIVLEMPVDHHSVNLVAHIVGDRSVKETDKESHLKELTTYIKEWEPDICLCIYAIHEGMLPYSPTTLKKDKIKMSKQLEGYVQVMDEQIYKIRFVKMAKGLFRIEKV